jgi:hypothetical protein
MIGEMERRAMKNYVTLRGADGRQCPVPDHDESGRCSIFEMLPCGSCPRDPAQAPHEYAGLNAEVTSRLENAWGQ